MNIRPIGNRILAEPLPEEEYSGGVYLPPVARDQLRGKFKVVSVGFGRIYPTKDKGPLRVMPDMRPGDTVICNKMAGTEVPVDGKRMRLIDANSVIAVIEA